VAETIRAGPGYLQTTPSSSAQLPWKHSENVSHVAFGSVTVQGWPSVITVGQVPVAFGGGPRIAPKLHEPTRHREAYPSQVAPGAPHEIAPQVPDSEHPTRATVEEQGPGIHPSPGEQSPSRRQYAPLDPRLQVSEAAPAMPTQDNGGAHPPGQEG